MRLARTTFTFKKWKKNGPAFLRKSFDGEFRSSHSAAELRVLYYLRAMTFYYRCNTTRVEQIKKLTRCIVYAI